MSTEITQEMIERTANEIFDFVRPQIPLNGQAESEWKVFAQWHLTKLSALAKENQELKVELETAKADRNRAGVVERQKYLPMIQELRAAMEVKDAALEKAKVWYKEDMLKYSPDKSIEGLIGAESSAFFTLINAALTPTAGRDLLTKMENMREALRVYGDEHMWKCNPPIFLFDDFENKPWFIAQQALSEGGDR